MNISSFIPSVNTTKFTYTKRSEIAVAGSEIGKEPHKQVPVQAKKDDQDEGQERREPRRDRRQRRMKPLIDLRSGRDRRKDRARLTINIDV